MQLRCSATSLHFVNYQPFKPVNIKTFNEYIRCVLSMLLVICFFFKTLCCIILTLIPIFHFCSIILSDNFAQNILKVHCCAIYVYIFSCWPIFASIPFSGDFFTAANSFKIVLQPSWTDANKKRKEQRTVIEKDIDESTYQFVHTCNQLVIT